MVELLDLSEQLSLFNTGSLLLSRVAPHLVDGGGGLDEEDDDRKREGQKLYRSKLKVKRHA